ncbi:hypothetical protein [Bosea vaviloviae]|uniref:Uncharacterized protein n=1 Tax=Bosea vaviloviae TaxID=1526658 RepID=A0A0N1F3R7_9HYPH|nr:hypothetical protein [Bosea vaviloviae]KPH80543.1 hypothetical protein AE618_12265 [Bosea vaviloviae]
MALRTLKPTEARDPYARLVMDAFDRQARSPADFPREALVQVETFDHEQGELRFTARVVRASSESHLRIRTDDGLIFAVPAADCTLIEERRP